ncbi:unnamed protein product [Mucor circinelloides]|uniref:NodB homology domain-containing protein n=1 Tax=Mucor circinelloides f. circinelloides (strain 1006PhL) TaxID=1220926 RepID=S2K494_MUCC1|nr:hypothetical protein HMPREF1544_02992 [Mucor circinelloides 1006PhL]
MVITNSILLFAAVAQVYGAAINKRSVYAPQFSPPFPPMAKPTGVVTSYNPGPYDTSSTLSTTPLSGFPEPWSKPDTNNAEVQAVYNKLDLSKIPKAPVRKQNSDGSWVSNSDGASDPYCWWSSTNCVVPKASYLPPDIYTCPNKGDWGLNYDDGPFNRYTDSNAAVENKYAEPALYNFLAENNLHSTLFYIGSNVATFPAAAQRGLNDGHQLCVHTWSHPPLTTQTNIQIVAELYWTLKAIKAATGVTSRCFRPPQGDIDDRVRAIAWQMGMRTVLWDADTEDWNLPAPNGGSLSPSVVDGYFSSWINSYKSGKDTSGRIVLEHELNHATVNISMFWLPKLTKTFNVIPALSCNGITKDVYWEDFEYPTYGADGSTPTTTKATSTTTTTTTTKATTNTTTTTTKKTTTTTTKKTTSKTTTTKTTTSKAPTSTSTKCTAGVSGKKQGDGDTGYCCTSSDDCIETCRSGVCGL